MVMAAQFESWRYPLIVMVTVPLAAIGALWAMFLTGANIGVASLVGVLLMVGIVVNNGIVLVDYTNAWSGRAWTSRKPSSPRPAHGLRPVLMTAVTTIGGLLPIGGQPGARHRTAGAPSHYRHRRFDRVDAVDAVRRSVAVCAVCLGALRPTVIPTTARTSERSGASRLLAVALIDRPVVGTTAPPAHAQDNVSGLNLIAGVGYPERPGGPPLFAGRRLGSPVG